MSGECLIHRGAQDADARIFFSKNVNTNDSIAFDRVVVIPLRSQRNLFHFAEGLNTLVRFFLRYNYPVVLIM